MYILLLVVRSEQIATVNERRLDLAGYTKAVILPVEYSKPGVNQGRVLFWPGLINY